MYFGRTGLGGRPNAALLFMQILITGQLDWEPMCSPLFLAWLTLFNSSLFSYFFSPKVFMLASGGKVWPKSLAEIFVAMERKGDD